MMRVTVGRVVAAHVVAENSTPVAVRARVTNGRRARMSSPMMSTVVARQRAAVLGTSSQRFLKSPRERCGLAGLCVRGR